jgi:hypothetical protein
VTNAKAFAKRCIARSSDKLNRCRCSVIDRKIGTLRLHRRIRLRKSERSKRYDQQQDQGESEKAFHGGNDRSEGLFWQEKTASRMNY